MAAGRFNKPEDVVRAGLELLEQQEPDMARLRHLIDDGDADIAAGKVALRMPRR
jgi:Arc/MetJ-type ribon-helix-helix transcriptional regulator